MTPINTGYSLINTSMGTNNQQAIGYSNNSQKFGY